MDNGTSVAIVLVNYNSGDDCLRCMNALRTQSYQNFQVFLVDNSSPDRSGEKLLREQPAPLGKGTVQVLLNPENKGFGAGANIGLALARAYATEFVWLLNPDAIPEADALQELVAALRAKPQAAMVGSKILRGIPGNSEPKILWGAGGRVDATTQTVSMLGSGERDSADFSQAMRVDYIPGCSLLVRTALLVDIGLFPEEYFMYFEETDWCQRAKQKGFELWFVPQSVVWHDVSLDKMQSPFAVYYYNRNRRLFWSRQVSAIARLKLKAETLFRELPRAFHGFTRAPSPSYRKLFGAHILSCVDFLAGRFGARHRQRLTRN